MYLLNFDKYAINWKVEGERVEGFVTMVDAFYFDRAKTFIFPDLYIFRITRSKTHFKSDYSGYYGFGPVQKFDDDPRNKNIAQQFRDLGKIDYLVAAFYSCEDI